MERNPFSRMLVTPTPFVGRQELLTEILAGVTGTPAVAYGVIGLKGYGKTSLLRQIAGILSDRERLVQHVEGMVPEVKPVYLDFGGWEGDSVLPRIHTAVATVLKEYAEAELAIGQTERAEAKSATMQADEPAQASGTDVVSMVEQLRGRHPRIVLLLDDFDLAYTSISEPDENTLRQLLPAVPAVIATEEPWEYLKKDRVIWSPLFRYFQMRFRLEPLSKKEALELLQPTGDLIGRFDSCSADWAFKLSGGFPRLLLLISEAFYRMRLTGERVRNTQKNPKLYDQIAWQLLAERGLKDDFVLWWEQLTDDEREVLTQLASRASTGLETKSNAVARLRDWHLLCDEKGRDRIRPRLFADYIRLLQRPLSTRRGHGTTDDRLLAYLQDHPNTVCTYEELLQHVWGDPAAEGRRVENAVGRLRKRLGRDAIDTIYGKGIRYNTPIGGSQAS